MVTLTSHLAIKSVGAEQAISIGGLVFLEGFTVNDCVGDVSLTQCTAIDDGTFSIVPNGAHFAQTPYCGVGSSRHGIRNCAAVTLVDCSLAGRAGWEHFCDGRPGEHALMVENSRVAIYGGSLSGGKGGLSFDCHGTFAGSRGDAIWADGPTWIRHLSDGRAAPSLARVLNRRRSLAPLQ